MSRLTRTAILLAFLLSARSVLAQTVTGARTAEYYGASVSVSAATNTAAIQAALNAAAGGEVTLLTPGTFLISNTLGSVTRRRRTTSC
jgi:hypothetical protein